MYFFLKSINLKNSPEYKYALVSPSSNAIKHALYQSILKSQKTNSKSQAEIDRDSWKKLNKQFEGIFAELACYSLLKQKLSDINGLTITRFDDIRTGNYEYSIREFDLKIETFKSSFNFEIRASVLYSGSVLDESVLKNYDIIGPYINNVKQKENYNDYYLRPLYVIKDKSLINKKDLIEHNFIYYFIRNKIELCIVCGCTKQHMTSDKSYIKGMGQGNTKYRCIKMKDAQNLSEFISELQNTLTLLASKEVSHE